jgi:hypothetical protein
VEIEEEQMFKNVKDKVLVRLEESIKRTEDYKKWDKFLLRYIGNIENIMHKKDFNCLLQVIKKEYITEIKRRFFNGPTEFPYISYKDLDIETVQLKEKEIKEAYFGKIKSSNIIRIYRSLTEVESLSNQIERNLMIEKLVFLKTGRVLAISL